MSENKMMEIKNDRGKTILIPKDNIFCIIEGDRGINYIYLKDSKDPFETTEYINSLKAKFES